MTSNTVLNDDKLWIVGQFTEDNSWAFQGVFSDLQLADNACRDENYFIFPVTLNHNFPHKNEDYKIHFHPRKQDKD